MKTAGALARPAPRGVIGSLAKSPLVLWRLGDSRARRFKLCGVPRPENLLLRESFEQRCRKTLSGECPFS